MRVLAERVAVDLLTMRPLFFSFFASYNTMLMRPTASERFALTPPAPCKPMDCIRNLSSVVAPINLVLLNAELSERSAPILGRGDERPLPVRLQRDGWLVCTLID
jgi:hypothetical protein